MAGLALKEYQRESLDAIGRFCDAVRGAVGTKALRPVHDAYYAETGRDFIQVPQLPNVPYVCLRVPTGGGKTLVAAHAVGVIGKRLGHQDRPLCLWVTPSTTIRDQTLRGLRDREHPYNVGLREGLGVPVEVLTVEEALSASRPMLSSSAVIVVTTIQSYRIDEEANRKVYQDNGYLMDHFTNLPTWVREELAEPGNGANGGNGAVSGEGRVSLSLANVMKLRGPIIIMDEAHNARTRISFDSLARFGPLAVLELTATPQQEHEPDNEEYASNVLHAVSALQLKREGMIKLPVELESRDNWLDVLATTKDRRDALERRAQAWGQQSGRFIRPIALIQAQPKSKAKETHTVDAIKTALMERFKVPADRIRIATGDKDDLGAEDLRAQDCTVEYILTVDKLREGWDCPFAYVLGSVGNVATETAVEQLLGRVLRMPDAVPTGIPELDRAYAVVQSADVAATANRLCDGLVSRCGFDAESVGDAFRVHRRVDAQGLLPVATIPVSAAPDPAQLPEAVRGKVEYDAGSGTLHVREPLTRDETIALRDSLGTLTDRAAVEQYWHSERGVGTAAKKLDDYATPLRVPQLIVRDGQRSYLFEPEELDEFSWNLNACESALTGAEMSVELNVGDRVTLGVTDRGAVRIGGVEEVIVRQLSFVAEGDDWSKAELVRWLDSELHHGGAFAGLAKAQSQAWLSRVVDSLLTDRKADLRILVRKRHELANAVLRRISAHGRLQVRATAKLLIDGQSPRQLETSMDLPLVLAEQDYCPYRQYRGAFGFAKHAFTLIGEMGDEESQCAKRIDDHPNVKRWVRNLTHESAGGFSLPLSPGRFFPDFIAELQDGRIVIIEYKNAKLAQATEEQHKKMVGELWEARSGGRCRFAWVVERNWPALESALEAKA
ncbi:MAG: DEAD/DEAH box helicase family protein [Planctomycetes bacterium]|nr:DEAD/DEAH box helicase family protein [Planctomycetota bacterium]